MSPYMTILTNIQNYNNTSYLYLGNNAIQQLHVLSSDPNQNKIGNRYKSLYLYIQKETWGFTQ